MNEDDGSAVGVSGFDPAWLALREPVDIRARDAGLVAGFGAAVAAIDGPVAILDIGCGTGASYRALSPHVSAAIGWRLMDHDAGLIAAARRLLGDDGRIAYIEGDLLDIGAWPLSDTPVVTASALFDLCSATFIDGVARQLAVSGIGLYAALNYDGRMRWSIPHDLDDAVVLAFNRHQESDKGFGDALGPKAWERLRAAFSERGYTVQTATSDWVLVPGEADLQRAFVDGVAAAVAETGRLKAGRIDAWRDFRVEAIRRDGSSALVGHVDVLALRA